MTNQLSCLVTKSNNTMNRDQLHVPGISAT